MPKDDCSKHPREIKEFAGNLDELAQKVGNLQYDCTASFIESMADDFQRQADKDYSKGRKKLALKLYETAQRLYSARDSMMKAWEICEPYMAGKKRD
jgi:propanediol dehydratase small subunit